MQKKGSFANVFPRLRRSAAVNNNNNAENVGIGIIGDALHRCESSAGNERRSAAGRPRIHLSAIPQTVAKKRETKSELRNKKRIGIVLANLHIINYLLNQRISRQIDSR